MTRHAHMYVRTWKINAGHGCMAGLVTATKKGGKQVPNMRLGGNIGLHTTTSQVN